MANISNTTVVSYNVNGLKAVEKRRAIFHYLKHFKSNIILLQETHSTVADETVWSNEWGSKIYFCHGSNYSKGVAVLIDKNFPVQVGGIRIDQEGRFLLLDVTIGDFSLVIVNVYGPNEDDPTFYQRLFEIVNTRENESLILAGDFNTTLDPEKDLYNNAGSNHVKKRKVLRDYLESKGLVDIWRIQHKNDRIFSWKKTQYTRFSNVQIRLFYCITGYCVEKHFF